MPRPPAEIRRLEDEERRRLRADRRLIWGRRLRAGLWILGGILALGGSRSSCIFSLPPQDRSSTARGRPMPAADGVPPAYLRATSIQRADPASAI